MRCFICSDRKERGLSWKMRGVCVRAMWALVRGPCTPWAGSTGQGSGVAKLTRGGSVSHVNQTPTTIELSISALDKVFFLTNPAAWIHFSTIFFNINMINLSLSLLYCNTSSLVWPSHAPIPLPWWQRGCTVGDQEGWGSLCIMKKPAYQKLTSSSPTQPLPAPLAQSGKDAETLLSGCVLGEGVYPTQMKGLQMRSKLQPVIIFKIHKPVDFVLISRFTVKPRAEVISWVISSYSGNRSPFPYFQLLKCKNLLLIFVLCAG